MSEKKVEEEQHRSERIEETGQVTLDKNSKQNNIHLITIIGEVEGHDNLGSNSKTTKYEHILPQLAAIEDSKDIDGVLVLLNTMGGDVEAGLAIAEMIASLSKPTVSLVLGGSHSIGVPIAVSTDYSYIVPTGTMVIHPVRMNGMVIGVPQTFDYFKQIQNRICVRALRYQSGPPRGAHDGNRGTDQGCRHDSGGRGSGGGGHYLRDRRNQTGHVKASQSY